MSSRVVSVMSFGVFSVVFMATEARAQFWRLSPPPQCQTYFVYEPAVVVYEVPVMTYVQLPTLPAPYIWEGNLEVVRSYNGGVAGSLCTPEGEQVPRFKITEVARATVRAGGPGTYRVRVCTQWSHGPFGIEKTRTIMEVIEPGTSTIPMEQKIETYEQPRLKIPNAPAPKPPAEGTVVQPRPSTILMPESLQQNQEKPYVPGFEEVPSAPTNSPEEEEPQGNLDPAGNEQGAKKPLFKNPKIAAKKSAVK